MPKNWLYGIALLLPIVLRIGTLPFCTEWLWYNDYPKTFHFFNHLSVQPQFQQFIGGWAYPFFVGTVLLYWSSNSESTSEQFLLLPLGFVPFAVFGDWLVHRELALSNMYIFPLIIIPAGYAYIITWAVFVRVLDKLKLVL